MYQNIIFTVFTYKSSGLRMTDINIFMTIHLLINTFINCTEWPLHYDHMIVFVKLSMASHLPLRGYAIIKFQSQFPLSLELK